VTAEQYWISKTVVVDWKLADPTTGVFVPGATVTGTVTLPNGTTAGMTVAELVDRYRATYDPATAGLHAWRLAATGVADGAEEGTFVVRRSLVGAQPITVDPTTAIGQVRLLISDTDEADPVFSDAEVTAFLALESSNVRMAAAQALDTIASNEVMVSKVIRTQDLQTDGSKVAAELRARATSLREQAAATDDTGAVFGLEIVNFDPTGWALSGNGL
jgi:hypothetical protein